MSIFCSSVRAREDDEADSDLDLVVSDLELGFEEELGLELRWWWWFGFWRRDLASASRFSSSRSFWIRFCSISDRLNTFLLPTCSARLCLFFNSSCFRMSMKGFLGFSLLPDPC